MKHCKSTILKWKKERRKENNPVLLSGKARRFWRALVSMKNLRMREACPLTERPATTHVCPIRTQVCFICGTWVLCLCPTASSCQSHWCQPHDASSQRRFYSGNSPPVSGRYSGLLPLPAPAWASAGARVCSHCKTHFHTFLFIRLQAPRGPQPVQIFVPALSPVPRHLVDA